MCYILPRLSSHPRPQAPPLTSCLQTLSADGSAHFQARTPYCGHQSQPGSQPSPCWSSLWVFQNHLASEWPFKWKLFRKKKYDIVHKPLHAHHVFFLSSWWLTWGSSPCQASHTIWCHCLATANGVHTWGEWSTRHSERRGRNWKLIMRCLSTFVIQSDSYAWEGEPLNHQPPFISCAQWP